jgi:hypothetical protein
MAPPSMLAHAGVFLIFTAVPITKLLAWGEGEAPGMGKSPPHTPAPTDMPRSDQAICDAGTRTRLRQKLETAPSIPSPTPLSLSPPPPTPPRGGHVLRERCAEHLP